MIFKRIISVIRRNQGYGMYLWLSVVLMNSARVLSLLCMISVLTHIQISHAAQPPEVTDKDGFESFSDLQEIDMEAKGWNCLLNDAPREWWHEDEKEAFKWKIKREEKRKEEEKKKAIERRLKQKANKTISSAGIARDAVYVEDDCLSGGEMGSGNYTQKDSEIGSAFGAIAYDMVVTGMKFTAGLCCLNVLYNYAEKGYEKCCAYIKRLRNKKNKEKNNGKVKQKDCTYNGRVKASVTNRPLVGL